MTFLERLQLSFTLPTSNQKDVIPHSCVAVNRRRGDDQLRAANLQLPHAGSKIQVVIAQCACVVGRCLLQVLSLEDTVSLLLVIPFI